MKIKKLMLASAALLSTVLLFGCSSNKQEVKIYDTTDLHSHFTKQLKEEISKIDRKNSILLDAGDFVDGQTPDDEQWYTGNKSIGYINNEVNGHVVEKLEKPMNGLPPISQEIVNAKYDADTLGNHEFYLPPDTLKELIDGYKKAGVPLLSANTYFNKEYIGSDKDERVSEPYIKIGRASCRERV